METNLRKSRYIWTAFFSGFFLFLTQSVYSVVIQVEKHEIIILSEQF